MANSGFATNPIILSGKQASKPNNPVSAILAAIVIHNVPFSHFLLCSTPKAL